MFKKGIYECKKWCTYWVIYVVFVNVFLISGKWIKKLMDTAQQLYNKNVLSLIPSATQLLIENQVSPLCSKKISCWQLKKLWCGFTHNISKCSCTNVSNCTNIYNCFPFPKENLNLTLHLITNSGKVHTRVESHKYHINLNQHAEWFPNKKTVKYCHSKQISKHIKGFMPKCKI